MSNYPFLPYPQNNGASQLLAINSALTLEYAPSFSDIFDFSEFTGEDWNVAQSSEDESGFNFLYSWKSDLGSVLTQVQSATFTEDESDDELLPGYDQLDYSHVGLATFSTKNGDKFSINRKNTVEHFADPADPLDLVWHTFSFSTQVNANYVGLQGTTDDVIYVCRSNVRGWSADDGSQGGYTDTFNISAKTNGDSAFSIKTIGTYTKNWEESTIHNLKLNSFEFKDTDNGLNLSFKGSLTYRDGEEGHNDCDIMLNKVVATTNDFKCTTAVLNVRNQQDFYFDALPRDNYSQVTVNYFEHLEPIMMRGANIITITNRDGAYIDAGNGVDRITGNIGSDVIKGGAGRDIINGGTTSTTQTGGADLFVYGRETAGYINSLTTNDDNNINLGISSTSTHLNRDTIADFKPGEDQIGIDAREIGWSEVYRDINAISEISSSNFKIFAAGTVFTSSVATTAPLNQGVTTDKSNSYLMLVLGAASSTLYIDLDASGTIFNPVALATLTGVFTATNITNNDFVLVG